MVLKIKKKITQKRLLLYNIFNNVIYFSISSFFNSNIHKILTVQENMSYGTSENSYKK